MAYATLAQVKAYQGVDSDADDALLTQLLAAAVSWVESPAGVGRLFEVATATTRYFTRESLTKRTLWLDFDLCRLDEVTNGDGSTIPTAAVRTDPRNSAPYFALHLLPTAAYAWDTSNDGEIAVTGLWGYSATPPAAITQAVIRLTAWLYRQRKSSSDADRPLITGDGVVILPNRLPNDVAQLLAAYRKVTL